MTGAGPRYLLMTDVIGEADNPAGGYWKFVLQQMGGREQIEAFDREPGSSRERLHLWAVVRGLEELGQPSRVKLVTPSRFIVGGLRGAIDQWRENQWEWECFGEMAPVKYADLWQRIDRARQIHQVECRIWRLNGADCVQPPEQTARTSIPVSLSTWTPWNPSNSIFSPPAAVPAGYGHS